MYIFCVHRQSLFSSRRYALVKRTRVPGWGLSIRGATHPVPHFENDQSLSLHRLISYFVILERCLSVVNGNFMISFHPSLSLLYSYVLSLRQMPTIVLHIRCCYPASRCSHSSAAFPSLLHFLCLTSESLLGVGLVSGL